MTKGRRRLPLPTSFVYSTTFSCCSLCQAPQSVGKTNVGQLQEVRASVGSSLGTVKEAPAGPWG